MATADIVNRLTVDGISFSLTASVLSDGVTRKEKIGTTALAIAKVGQLTTRTDNDTGTLTMVAGHGIATGNRLDLFWTEAGVKGQRRGVVVGTVSVNSVPIDLGAGDNLPTNLTAITAQVPAVEEFLVTGSNAQFIGGKSSRRGIIVLTDGSDVEKLAMVLPGDTGGAYQWYTGSGITNPIAAQTITKAYFSNGDSVNTNELVALVGPS